MFKNREKRMWSLRPCGNLRLRAAFNSFVRGELWGEIPDRHFDRSQVFFQLADFTAERWLTICNLSRTSRIKIKSREGDGKKWMSSNLSGMFLLRD